MTSPVVYMIAMAKKEVDVNTRTALRLGRHFLKNQFLLLFHWGLDWSSLFVKYATPVAYLNSNENSPLYVSLKRENTISRLKWFWREIVCGCAAY